MIRPIHITKTQTTPLVVWNENTNELIIEGVCCPIDASGFFVELNTWVEEHISKFANHTRFVFCLPFFNSSSAKAIYVVMNHIKELIVRDSTCSIVWIIEDEDDFMIDSHEDFEEILEMSIQTSHRNSGK
jgi:hypothetical protein